MARVTSTSSRRRIWLPFILVLIIVLCYRKSKRVQSYESPGWNVIDFQVKDYKSREEIYVADTAEEDFLDQHGTHRQPGHNHHGYHEYQAQIDAIRGRPAFQQQQLSYDALQDKIQQFIQWNRPSTDHWPAWHDYDDADYDPNRWEALDREYGYYLNNTVQELEHAGHKPEPYLPYPNYNSLAWRKKWHGQYKACEGPQGELLGEASTDDHVVHGYRTLVDNSPPETLGSAKVLGLDTSFCFDRYSRYSPYGMKDHNFGRSSRTRWDRMRWGALQEACLEKNAERYVPDGRTTMPLKPSKVMHDANDPLDEANKRRKDEKGARQYKSRTAILIRTWEGYEYKENDIQAIRALVTETSLLSGGEYQVFLFVNIKQREADIYNDDKIYRELLKQTVPAELRDMAILWTERVCEEWYPNVGDWQVYWMQFMPLQWFSKQHPEFDYVWNWETDARYIGNHYHFLEQISAFSKQIPRKHLWERNSRFFFPASWNGDYDAFLADTDEKILNASAMGLIDEPVWGPRPYAPFQYPLGPFPPTIAEEDNFEWGVGEEADLISLQPIWDPAETEWSYRNHVWNFIPEVRPHFSAENPNDDGFDHPGFPTIPRRTFINTVVRFSKRMLHIMHLENMQGRAMQAEMWPATVALHHGLKAVYAPHPIWTDRIWPAWYAEAVFNADDGIPARWSQQLDSPYNHDREANFGGWSWYYRSVFSHVLYRRWLGWKAKDWGWDADIARETEQEEKEALAEKLGKDVEELDDLRMCLPGMLLHPVKHVYEGADGG
ncbi:hypothetical protein LTR05_006446 [Lithohypha guttulata]|uniref:Major facilitator superfamily transporter n=1 Tax=Lithohypha guttulata TaxID=1690604 RepID=A0AAN7SXW8_9EURO|nr:hypothetical protein LTR05_006446 [Lithohypha guttulata]